MSDTLLTATCAHDRRRHRSPAIETNLFKTSIESRIIPTISIKGNSSKFSSLDMTGGSGTSDEGIVEKGSSIAGHNWHEHLISHLF